MRRPATLAAAILLAGCSGVGSTVRRLPDGAAARGYVQISRPVTLPRSRLTSDCGPETLCAVINYWGKPAGVQEISILVRDTNVNGILTTRVPALARAKGLTAVSRTGSVGHLKNAIDRDVPPIIMVDSGSGAFHFFVVTAYNDREQTIVCEEYDDSKRLIGYEEVEERWKPAGHLMIELEKSTADDDFQAGADREAKGRYGEAIDLYKRALKADPTHYEARVGLGNCYLFTQKLEEARAEYRRAYEINPADPKVCNNLANVLVELKREAAEAERLSAAAVDHYRAEVARTKEGISRETRPSVRGLRQKELALQELDLAAALGTLGQALALADRPVPAIAAWTAALDHYPLTESDARARRLLEIGLAQRRISMPADAKRTLERALAEAKDARLREKIEAALKD